MDMMEGMASGCGRMAVGGFSNLFRGSVGNAGATTETAITAGDRSNVEGCCQTGGSCLVSL